MAGRVRVRETDEEQEQRLLRIIRRDTGSVVTWRRAQPVGPAARRAGLFPADARSAECSRIERRAQFEAVCTPARMSAFQPGGGRVPADAGMPADLLKDKATGLWVLGRKPGLTRCDCVTRRGVS